jgi:ABC-type transporter Mla subunit MlaD
MTKERNNLKAGAFILLSIGLIVTVILSIKGVGRIFSPEQERTVSFRLADDLGGLQIGDEVRVGGFKVGVVKDIEVRDDVREAGPVGGAASQPLATTRNADPTRLLVTFTLPSQYQLREDAAVGIQTTVTGTACLNISDLGTGKPADAQVALVGRPSALNSLIATFGDLAPEVKPLVADARGAVADVRARVVPNLGATLEQYKGAGEHLRDMLGDTKSDFRTTVANLKESTGTIKEQLPPTMDNLRETTGTLKEKLPGTMEAAKQFITRLDETVKSTEGTLEDVKKSMANLRAVSEDARDVVGGNRGKLDTMIASLKTTGDNLKAASAEIRHSPWRLLYKPGKGEMANLNLYDSARQFADGAGSLNDAALALRDALASDKADPKQVKELLGKLDQSFANFRQVEDKLWSSVKE